MKYLIWIASKDLDIFSRDQKPENMADVAQFAHYQLDDTQLQVAKRSIMTIKMEYDNVVQLLMQAKDLIMRQNEHTQSFIDGLRTIFPPETIAKFLIDLDKRRRVLEDRITEIPEPTWPDDFSTQKILNAGNYRAPHEQASSSTSFMQHKSMVHTTCHPTTQFSMHASGGLGACTPNNQALLSNFLSENEPFNIVDTQLERLFCDQTNNLSTAHTSANSSACNGPTVATHLNGPGAHAPGNATPVLTPGMAAANAANMIVTGGGQHNHPGAPAPGSV
jgi:hypothetical protein